MSVDKTYFVMKAIKLDETVDFNHEKMEDFDFDGERSVNELGFVYDGMDGKYIYVGEIMDCWNDEEDWSEDREIEFKPIKKSEREKIEKFTMKHFGKKGKVKMVFFTHFT